jgi:hypothetical protein
MGLMRDVVISVSTRDGWIWKAVVKEKRRRERDGVDFGGWGMGGSWRRWVGGGGNHLRRVRIKISIVTAAQGAAPEQVIQMEVT